MEMVNIDGCMLGLKSSHGNPIMKPWTLQSTFPELVKMFSQNCRCTKSHVHDLAAGCETANTAFYPRFMCDKIHQSIRAHISYRTSDPDLPTRSRPAESEETMEAWLMAEANVSESELDERYEKVEEPEVHLPLASNRQVAVNPVNLNNSSTCFLANKDMRSAACASIGTKSIYCVDNLWIFDSGCGFDMCTEDKIKHLMKYILPAEPQEFNTANGPYESSEVVSLSFRMGNVRYDARPYLMEDTPSVLSMGMRCMNEGFCFIWIKGFDPCVITPTGHIEPLCVINCVPYLESRKSSDARRDQLTDCSVRCGVSVRDGQIVISTVVGSHGAVACPATSPGPSQANSSSVNHDAEEPADGVGHTTSGGR